MTVTLLREQAKKLREVVAAHQVDSVSATSPTRSAAKLTHDAALRRLEQHSSQPPTEALAWKRRTFGVDTEATA